MLKLKCPKKGHLGQEKGPLALMKCTPLYKWKLWMDFSSSLSLSFFFFFFAKSYGLWDVSPPTRNQAWALTVKVPSCNHWTTGEFPVSALSDQQSNRCLSRCHALYEASYITHFAWDPLKEVLRVSFLAVQWLRLPTSAVGGTSLLPGREAKMPHGMWWRPGKKPKPPSYRWGHGV